MKINTNDKLAYIERANNLIKKLKKNYRLLESIAGSSELAYRRAITKYLQEKREAMSEGRSFEFDRLKKNSRRVSSAAIRRNAIDRLRQIERAETISEIDAILKEVVFDLNQVDSMLERHRDEITSEKSQGNSWKVRLRVLESLRPNWRDELQSKMAKSKYAKCVAVQRATGCRTDELISGVRVEKIDDVTYELTLSTAKQRVQNPDNRLRVIHSTSAALEQCVGVVKLTVADLVSEGISKVDYDHARVLAVEKAKKNYRMTMSNVSERFFGISITPKCFRCAMASDLRSSGADTVRVAELLGHGSTDCANTYSNGLNARGKARGQPAVLKMPRKKVESKPLSKTLAARKALQTVTALKY